MKAKEKGNQRKGSLTPTCCCVAVADELQRNSEPEHMREVIALRPHLDRRLSLLQRTIDARRSGVSLNELAAVVIAGEAETEVLTERLMDQLAFSQQAKTRRMHETGHALIRLRTTAIWALVSLLCLCVVGLVGGYTYSNRELQRRNELLHRMLKEARATTEIKSLFLAKSVTHTATRSLHASR